MTEETKKVSEPEQMVLDQLASLKAKMDVMVDPDKYKELEAQHKKLLDEYVNKRPAPITEKPHVTTKEDVDNLSRQLARCSKDVTNREYIELALKHRQAVLDVYDKDPFGMNGQKSAEAEQAASFYKQVLEESSTPIQFRMLMEQYVKDDPVVIQKIRAAKAEADKSNKKTT